MLKTVRVQDGVFCDSLVVLSVCQVVYIYKAINMNNTCAGATRS